MKKRIKSINFYMSIYLEHAKIYLSLFFTKIVLSAVIYAINSIYILKIAFDTFVNRNRFPELAQIIILVFLINTVLFCFNAWFNNIYKPKCDLRIKKIVQKKIFDKAKIIDLSYYDDPKFYDKYILSLNQADERVIQTLNNVGEIVSNVVGIITIISIIITIDFLSIFLVIASVCISFLFNARLGKLKAERNIKNVSNNRRKEYIQRVYYLKDYLVELKSLTKNDFIFDEYDQASTEAMKINTKYGRSLMRLSVVKGFIESILTSYSIYFILFYKLLIQKTITIGAFSAVINSIWALTERLNNIVDAMGSLYESSLYFDALNEFNMIKDHNRDNDLKEISAHPETLRVSNVSFTYDGKNEVLHDISLEIKPREKIAIVGENGAGKSTLINIMLGMYHDYQGKVTICDKDILQLDKGTLLDYYGVLFQDYNIYATTIENNVMMDLASEKNHESVVLSLKRVGFYDRLKEMKNGLNQIISKEYDPEGCDLSGGEMHKVAMARIIADKSKIIFLDEPSSMLDPISESNFNKLLMSEFNDRTVIFVSHRFIATKLVDRIFMIADGRIVESGSHGELMRLNGRYARLYKIQSKKYVINEG